MFLTVRLLGLLSSCCLSGFEISPHIITETENMRHGHILSKYCICRRNVFIYLFKGLLVLPVFESINKGVDGGRHPGKNRCHDMDGGELDIVVHHVDQHEWQEADKEGEEDGEHHLGQSYVLLPLG